MPIYRAVFSDMDGTLLNSRHEISPQTADAVKKIIAQGVYFMPVSARPPYAITPYTTQLGSPYPIICYSGALILTADFMPLYSVTLDTDDVRQIMPLVDGVSVSVYAGVNWFAAQPDNAWIKQESRITGLQPTPTPPPWDGVHKILLMGQSDRIAWLERRLQQAFPHLSVHRSKNEYLEIMHKAATKSNAIRFMQRHFNLNTDEIMVFGDHFNDLDMLQHAGLSIAMGNAPAAIKVAADRVTARHDEDGIALILQEYFVD